MFPGSPTCVVRLQNTWVSRTFSPVHVDKCPAHCQGLPHTLTSEPPFLPHLGPGPPETRWYQLEGSFSFNREAGAACFGGTI